jgi:hypothetical protein
MAHPVFAFTGERPTVSRSSHHLALYTALSTFMASVMTNPSDLYLVVVPSGKPEVYKWAVQPNCTRTVFDGSWPAVANLPRAK